MQGKSLAPPLAGPTPKTAATAAAFSIGQSPFSAADSLALQQAILAATQPVAQPSSPTAQPVQAAKRARSAEEVSPPAPAPAQQQRCGGKHRPPRPPPFADSGSQVLDVSLEAQEGGGSGGASPRTGRSPRSASASPGSRRPAKQMSKTVGRVCLECATTSTTQWRSQGLLCNSCGVKLIKGRLPMDADSMQRRWARLPPAIRDHPMWEAAQVVARAQGAAAAAAAAGQPWACPGCGVAGGERVAGPCGLHHCAACTDRYRGLAVPGGGAAAVAIAVAAPAPCASPPAPSPAAGGHKRRKQATPRSAATDSLSPIPLSSSGSSSIQAWQSGREEGQDDACSKEEPSTAGRPASRRLQQRQQQLEAVRAPLHVAAPTAAPPVAPAGSPGARLAETPTAAEAAAALLVLTESDELRVAAAAQLDAAPALAPLPAPSSPPAAAAPALDSMQLYSRLIGAAGTAPAAAAGLSHELVGRYLAAAHTQPAQALAASPEVAAAIRSQQAQQARLVAAMVAEGQYGAAVALMRGVVQLAGLPG